MSDQIKESFSKVKKDIYSLKEQLDLLNFEIREIKRTLNQTLKAFQQTDRRITPTDTPTHLFPLQGSKPRNIKVSIGNKGVPTDRQTDRHIQKFVQDVSSQGERLRSEEHCGETRMSATREEYVVGSQEYSLSSKESISSPNIPFNSLPSNLIPTITPTHSSILTPPISPVLIGSHPNTSLIIEDNVSQEQKKLDKLSQIDTVSQVLDSLDNLKKDIRSRFKKLTPQEIYVFSLIYQLEDQGSIVDYTLLSEKTKLSQSSIRDYILKLIKKGVPVDKTKENNKQVTLSIPKDFKKIASLDTILSLREI